MSTPTGLTPAMSFTARVDTGPKKAAPAAWLNLKGPYMRVLVVVPHFPALSETFIMRQVLDLEATVCAFKVNRKLPMPEGITVVEMPERQLPPRLYHYARAAARMSLGYGPYDLEPAQKRAFLEVLREHRPDVVLAQYGPMGGRPCIQGLPEPARPAGGSLSRL